MAKTKKTATGKTRIPKKIGGVKIPKEARRAGEALIEKAQSPAGRQVIASGLAMAATAAAAMAARQAASAPAAKPAEPGQPGAAGVVDPQAIADTIGQVTDAVLGRLFGGRKAG